MHEPSQHPRGAWTAPRRWIAILLLACTLLVGCANDTLYSELDEQQANELMAALLGSGIAAHKTVSPSKKGWEVQVARSDFPYAMQVLKSRGLPRTSYQSLGEVFKKEGFASSATEEKARYLHGLSQELSRTLSLMPGVVQARVHIALPDRDPLGEESATASSATVFIFERPDSNLRERETDIKVAVKDAVEGLQDVNKVTVKFFQVAAAPPPRRSGIAGSMPFAVASVGPMLGIGLAAAALVLLWMTFGKRLRARLARSPARPEAPPRVWNG
jgi:type III secretion protein J